MKKEKIGGTKNPLMYDPFGDVDKDRVPNVLDCNPTNPMEHGLWDWVKARVVTPIYQKVYTPIIKPPLVSTQRVVQRTIRQYVPSVSYTRAATRRAAVRRYVERKPVEIVRKLKKRIPEKEKLAMFAIKRAPIGMVSTHLIKQLPQFRKLKPEVVTLRIPTVVPGRMGLLAGAEAVTPVLREKVITPISRGYEKVQDIKIGRPFEYVRELKKGIREGYETSKRKGEVHPLEDILKGEEVYHRRITEPVSTWIGGERAKEKIEQEKRASEAYKLSESFIKPEWIQPSGKILLPTKLKTEVISVRDDVARLEKYAKSKGWQEPSGMFAYPDTSEGRDWAKDYKTTLSIQEKFVTPDRYYKEEFFEFTPEAQKYVEAYKTYETEEERTKGLPKPKPTRQFIRGAGELAVGLPGFFVFTIPRISAETAISPKAAPGKLYGFGKMFYGFAKEEPYRAAGSVAAMVLGGRAIRAAKAKTYNIPVQMRGVKPFIGEPSLLGKIIGRKYHPTLSARPLTKTELSAGVFREKMPYFHGTSQSFIETIKKGGGIEVSPRAGITDIEASLFLGAPKRPYIPFAKPIKTIRVKTGSIKGVSGLKDYVHKGVKPSTKVEIPYDVYARSVLKTIKKPSTKLTDLIKKQETIKKEIGKELLPSRKTKLRGRVEYLGEQINRQAIKEFGVKTRVFESPGAFLEWKTIPKKPSPKLTEMSLELEKLIVKMEKGTKIEHTKAAKYRDVLDSTRWKWRFERTKPKYKEAKVKVEAKIKEVMTEKELKRMDFLKDKIENLGLKEIEEAGLEAKAAVPTKAIMGTKWKGQTEWEYTVSPGTEFYPLESFRGSLYGKFGIQKGKYKIYDPMSDQFVEVLQVSEKAPRGFGLPKKIYKEQLKSFSKEEIQILKRLEPREATRYIAGHKLTKFLAEEDIPIQKGKVNFGEIKSIPKRSARSLEEYFEKYPGEYRIRGSIVERTQLGAKKIPGDVDTAIANPRVVANDLANIIRKTSGRKVKIKVYKDPTGTFGGTRFEVLTQIKGKYVTSFDVSSLRGHLGKVIAGKYKPMATSSVGKGNLLMEQLGEQLTRRAESVFRPGKGKLVHKIGPEAAGRLTRLKDIPKFEEMAIEMIKRGKKAHPAKLKKYQQAEEWLDVALGRKKAKFDVKTEISKIERIKPEKVEPLRPTIRKPIFDLEDIYKRITEKKPKKLTLREHEKIAKLKSELEDAQKKGDIIKVSRLEGSISRLRYTPREYLPIRPIPFLTAGIGLRELPRKGRVKVVSPERLFGISVRREERLHEKVEVRETVRVREERQREFDRVIERIVGRQRRGKREEKAERRIERGRERYKEEGRKRERKTEKVKTLKIIRGEEPLKRFFRRKDDEEPKKLRREPWAAIQTSVKNPIMSADDLIKKML